MPLLESSKKCFYKLSYIGNFSIQTKKKMNNIVWKYCKPNTNIKLVFSSFKISSLFSMEDKVPHDLRSYVVYKFFFLRCKADYVGCMKPHLSIRIKEHLEIDKKLNVYKHLNESQRWKALSNNDYFFYYSLSDNTVLFKHQKRYVYWLAETSIKWTCWFFGMLYMCVSKYGK